MKSFLNLFLSMLRCILTAVVTCEVRLHLFLFIKHKNEFQWDAYCLLVDCMWGGIHPGRAGCPARWGCLLRGWWVGVSAQGGGCLPGRCHVTYPIMHLMLPVCCLNTNWDPATVQLLIYCWLIMWPARHAGIHTFSPLWIDRHLWKHNLRKLRLRAVNMFHFCHANWNKLTT